MTPLYIVIGVVVLALIALTIVYFIQQKKKKKALAAESGEAPAPGDDEISQLLVHEAENKLAAAKLEGAKARASTRFSIGWRRRLRQDQRHAAFRPRPGVARRSGLSAGKCNFHAHRQFLVLAPFDLRGSRAAGCLPTRPSGRSWCRSCSPILSSGQGRTGAARRHCLLRLRKFH